MRDEELEVFDLDSEVEALGGRDSLDDVRLHLEWVGAAASVVALTEKMVDLRIAAARASSRKQRCELIGRSHSALVDALAEVTRVHGYDAWRIHDAVERVSDATLVYE